MRYEAVNAMLLNEFLKEHRQIQDLRAADAGQKKEIAELRSTIAQQQKEVGALAQQIEKVSTQIATNPAAPQVAQK